MTTQAANSDIVYKDANEALFVFLDNGNGNLIAYGLPSWQSFTPVSPIVVYTTLSAYLQGNITAALPDLNANVAAINQKVVVPLSNNEPVYINDPYTYNYTWNNGLIATKTRTYGTTTQTKTFTWNSSSQLIYISAWT